MSKLGNYKGGVKYMIKSEVKLTDKQKIYIADLIINWDSAGFLTDDSQLLSDYKKTLVIAFSGFGSNICDVFDIDFNKMTRDLNLDELIKD
jgi:hypothetical protein